MPKTALLKDSHYRKGMNDMDDPKALADGECAELVNAFPGYPLEIRKGIRAALISEPENIISFPEPCGGGAFPPGSYTGAYAVDSASFYMWGYLFAWLIAKQGDEEVTSLCRVDSNGRAWRVCWMGSGDIPVCHAGRFDKKACFEEIDGILFARIASPKRLWHGFTLEDRSCMLAVEKVGADDFRARLVPTGTGTPAQFKPGGGWAMDDSWIWDANFPDDDYGGDIDETAWWDMLNHQPSYEGRRIFGAYGYSCTLVRRTDVGEEEFGLDFAPGKIESLEDVKTRVALLQGWPQRVISIAPSFGANVQRYGFTHVRIYRTRDLKESIASSAWPDYLKEKAERAKAVDAAAAKEAAAVAAVAAAEEKFAFWQTELDRLLELQDTLDDDHKVELQPQIDSAAYNRLLSFTAKNAAAGALDEAMANRDAVEYAALNWASDNFVDEETGEDLFGRWFVDEDKDGETINDILNGATRFFLMDIPFADIGLINRDKVSDNALLGEMNQLPQFEDVATFMPPNDGWLMKYFKGRLFILGDGGTVYFSVPTGAGGGDDMMAAQENAAKYAMWFRIHDRIELHLSEGTKTTGIGVLGDDIYFFKSNRSYALISGMVDVPIRDVSDKIGCCDAATITAARINNRDVLFFMESKAPYVITNGGYLEEFAAFKVKDLRLGGRKRHAAYFDSRIWLFGDDGIFGYQSKDDAAGAFKAEIPQLTGYMDQGRFALKIASLNVLPGGEERGHVAAGFAEVVTVDDPLGLAGSVRVARMDFLAEDAGYYDILQFGGNRPASGRPEVRLTSRKQSPGKLERHAGELYKATVYCKFEGGESPFEVNMYSNRYWAKRDYNGGKEVYINNQDPAGKPTMRTNVAFIPEASFLGEEFAYEIIKSAEADFNLYGAEMEIIPRFNLGSDDLVGGPENKLAWVGDA
jgi:hypothetical protein